MDRKPNIIIITTDQQRIDTLGSYGSSFMNTPNIDRLADEGAIFTKAYCSNPVCTPSRVSLMTGQHLSRHGAYNIGTYAGNQSQFISSILKEHGYSNYHIGKAHWNAWGEINEETREVPVSGEPVYNFMGFHQAEFCIGHGHETALKSHYSAWLKRQGLNPEQFIFHPLFQEDPMETGDWDIPVSLHSGSWIVSRAIEVLEVHPEEKPFFLNLGFPDPHHPHVLPTEFSDRVGEDEVPMPRLHQEEGLCEHVKYIRKGTINQSRFVGRFKVAGNGDDENWNKYFQDYDKARKTRAYYYSMIQLLDQQIGQLISYLEKKEILDETLIIFTSDHGEMLGDHRIGQKGPLIYDEVVRVPLIIRYPSEVNPGEVSDCVSLVDICPSILDLLQIGDNIRRDGISLKRLMKDGSPINRQGIRIEYKEEPDRIRFKCWVTKEWKMAIYPDQSYGELYDLKNDPGELINLYEEPGYENIKIELIKQMLSDMERSEPISRRPSRV